MKRIGVDNWGEGLTRRLAGQLSRRSALARLGALLVAAPAFPLLPVQRARAADASGGTDFSRAAQTTDDQACNYWRYCGIDGNLCSCCGGSTHSCPPGSQPSPTSWIGSCINPADQRPYLVAYRDCCGASVCNKCGCLNTDHAMPIYRPQANNHVIWCIGTNTFEYHCSMSVLVGLAE
ncbi:MAG TPA: methylamine dehydrogenase (amicyanin) small subunit [Steroidobacteraceae bacterium]|nr:methylamine dehydrogenase (amicyanin) small subunit [Steroidobacteraceae bacterium]